MSCESACVSDLRYRACPRAPLDRDLAGDSRDMRTAAAGAGHSRQARCGARPWTQLPADAAAIDPASWDQAYSHTASSRSSSRSHPARLIAPSGPLERLRSSRLSRAATSRSGIIPAPRLRGPGHEREGAGVRRTCRRGSWSSARRGVCRLRGSGPIGTLVFRRHRRPKRVVQPVARRSGRRRGSG